MQFSLRSLVALALVVAATLGVVQVVFAAPPANVDFTFAPTNPVTGQAITFTSQATDDDGDIVTTEWDFDYDGTTFQPDVTDLPTDATATHTYNTTGTRTVAMRVTDGILNDLTSDVGIATHTVTVSAPNVGPTAAVAISPNPASIGTTVNFNASGSSDPDGTIVNYEWDLDGNGSFELDTGTSSTTSRTYTSGGARTIRVRVTDDDGAMAVDADTLFVTNASPTASFTVSPNPAQVGATVTFDATASNDPDGTIAKYEWDLDGNGTYETDAGTSDTTTQSYTTPGTRTIRLRVTDDDGAIATDADSLRINRPPIPSFTISPNPAILNETIALDASPSDDLDGVINIYQWDFDYNGTFSVDATGVTPTVSYATPGTRTIRLRVRDNDNATRELSRSVVVQVSRPNAAFTFVPAAPLPGQAVAFTSRSTPSGAPGNPQIVRTEWDFDYDPTEDFTPDATGPTAATSFATPGPKSVAIRVTETGGGFALGSGTVVVNAPPRASFNVAPGSPLDGDTVTFSSTSLDPDGPLTAQEWDLDGDGQFDDASGPVTARAFSKGSHLVRLRVTDAKGASTVTEGRFAVLARPLKLLSGVKVTLFGNLTRTGARFKRLVVRTPAKATVKIKCKGRGCPKGTTKKRTAKTRRLRFKKYERSFRAGTVITVTVTRSGYIGQYTSIKIRNKLRRYIRRDRCVFPSARKPLPCPDA